MRSGGGTSVAADAGTDGNLVLTYHYVRPANSEGVTGLTPEAFDRQIALVKTRYRLVSSQEFADGAAAGETGLGLITFDDGVLDQFVYAAPVLAKHRVPAVFYCPMRPVAEGVDFAGYEAAIGRADPAGRCGWCVQHLLHALAQELGFAELERRVRVAIDASGRDVTIDEAAMHRLYHYEVASKRWLKYVMAFVLDQAAAGAILREINQSVGLSHRDWFCSASQLASLQAAGHELGAHGFDHVAYSTLDLQAQGADMLSAKMTMDRLFGDRPRGIAFPFGRADTWTWGLVDELGYRPAFTTAKRVDCAQLERVWPTLAAVSGAGV
jgi:peptidoglycan/xylan/chitin deacetylase (PgdA/CDA1 family)